MTDISQIFQGTQIALPGSPALRLDASTWVIDEKLYENRVDGVKRPPVAPGEKPSTWVAKYLCHNHHFPHDQAFMRVYCQGPDEETEFLRPEVRAQQANPHFETREAKARKAFREGGCKSVPSLVGYGQSVQGEHGPVPGGYITYLVWEQVPGKVLTPEIFWSFARPKRDLIRRKFRAAYEEMVSFGWGPGGVDITKIIWDMESDDLWISGFRSSFPGYEKWEEYILACYGLINPPADASDDFDDCENLDGWEW